MREWECFGKSRLEKSQAADGTDHRPRTHLLITTHTAFAGQPCHRTPQMDQQEVNSCMVIRQSRAAGYGKHSLQNIHYRVGNLHRAGC